MSAPNRTTSSNHILRRLSKGDLRLLEPHLRAVNLPARQTLELPQKLIDQVYFIDSGFASVIANAPSGRSIEVGQIGREGVTGMAVIMGDDRTPNETFMQSAGEGRRVSVANLRAAMARSQTLHRTLLNYCHTVAIQMAQTAVASGRQKILQRLARWLCMVHDRTDGDEIVITHEVVALMLGVRRPGLTSALGQLEKIGLIKTGRGVIAIIDRKRLEKSIHGTYGGPEAEFRRLFAFGVAKRMR